MLCAETLTRLLLNEVSVWLAACGARLPTYKERNKTNPEHGGVGLYSLATRARFVFRIFVFSLEYVSNVYVFPQHRLSLASFRCTR